MIDCLLILAATSRLDLLRDDGEHDVLVASPHHCSQRLVLLDGAADVAGRGDSLAIDGDDDISLLQASAVSEREKVFFFSRISFC